MTVNINNIYPRPSTGVSATIVPQLTKTVTSTAAVQFTGINTQSDLVFFDIQGGDVMVTFDNSTPATGSSGNRLIVGTNYTWRRGTFSVAKFLAVGTTAFISAQEFQV